MLTSFVSRENMELHYQVLSVITVAMHTSSANLFNAKYQNNLDLKQNDCKRFKTRFCVWILSEQRSQIIYFILFFKIII